MTFAAVILPYCVSKPSLSRISDTYPSDDLGKVRLEVENLLHSKCQVCVPLPIVITATAVFELQGRKCWMRSALRYHCVAFNKSYSRIMYVLFC